MRKIQLITTIDELRRLEPTWNEVLSCSSSDNFFLTWDWIWTWWTVYARKTDRLAVLVWQEHDRVVGIAPCYVREKVLCRVMPVKSLLFLGTQEEGEGDVGSDYMDLICRAGDEERFIQELYDYIAQKDLCDEICFARLDCNSKTVTILQAEARKAGLAFRSGESYVSPCINLPATWEEYLGSISANLRYKIRNERRKFEKTEVAEFVIAQSEEDALAGLENLIRLHQKRWVAKGQSGSFSNEQFLMFHRKLAPVVMKKGMLRLALIKENGQAKAALYNFQYRNKIYFYQSGVDAASGSPAFGYLLHSYCIEQAIKNGLAEYDFLPKGGTDDYKDRFSNSARNVSSIRILRSRAVRWYTAALDVARYVYHRVKPLLRPAELGRGRRASS